MALIVQKFGGTSVADAARIRAVAARVAEAHGRGDGVVVVVSAMGGATDGLIRLAREVCQRPPPRELDMLLSTGEQVTISLLAMALADRGVKARSLTGQQVGIVTEADHTRARILRIDGARARAGVDAGEVVVVAGFQGVTEGAEITTLGRGGSDLTAVAMAAALDADVCEIYTDVDGVYTADPRIVRGARKIERITYDEMLEMASLGAKVLQARSVQFAMKHGVPVHVRSSFKPDPGTLIVSEEDPEMEDVVVRGVTHDTAHSKITLLDVRDEPGVVARIFGAVSEAGVCVDMIVQNVSHDGSTDVTFTVPRGDREAAVGALERARGVVGGQGVDHDDGVAKISIVGVGMKSHGGVATRMFEALGTEGINIQMISTSEIAISCLVEEKYTELAVRALHQAFGLEQGA